LHPGKICEDSVCTAAPTGGQGCPAATPWDTEACTCPFAGNNTTNDYSNAWTGSGNSVCAYGLSADEVFIESVDGSSPEANQHDHAEPDMIVDKDGNPWIVYRDTHTNDIYLRRWDPTEGAWLYWDRMLEFWNNKFPVFPLNTREQAHDGLAMPRLTYEKIDVDVGAGTAEEVEVVAIVWAEKFICSQESYVCGDLTESICENAWQCEWDGDSCEYNQSSGQFYLPCDSDTNCPDSHTCSYNSDSTWTNTCCDVDITAQKQMVQALAFAKPAGEGTWQHKLLGYHNDYENTDDVTYTLYDPDIAIVTHGTTTNASNSVEPGDVALSYVVKSEDKSDGDDITTWKIPVSSYTFKDPSAIYACYYWKKEACSQYIGNYDSCVEQGCTWNGSSDDCYASNSSACVLSGDVEGVGEYAGSDNIAHKLEADPGICSQHVASPACATAGCYWDNDTCIILYNNVSRPDLSWSRIHIDCSSRTGAGNCNADNYCFWDAGACEAPVTGASLNDDWTYYIAWEQDGYTTSASTSVAQSGVFVRRLDPENKWGDAGNAPAGHATDESYGLSADTTQDFSQPRVRNGAYGTPRITFLNNDAQEVKGLYYKTETNTWEVASAVNDVNSSGDANLLLGTLNYETSACAHNILGWQNDCDSYTTQSECEEKGCAWNGACTEADGSSSNVQIVGHFNGAWTTMGRAKSATETSTILAQINDASGVAAELSFALGPRDTNHNQTLCAAWRNHHTTDDTYGIFAVCKDMDTNTASAGKYCCDGVGLSGECTLKGAGVVCTANYECLSNICTEGSCN
jgi:hypothetical protein